MKNMFNRKLLAILMMTILLTPMLLVQPAHAAGFPSIPSLICSASTLRSIRLSSSSVTLNPKQSRQLRVTYTPASAKAPTTWKSSNTKVATVSSNGLVTAKAAGTCTITANCLGKTASCKVTVKAATVNVTSVSVKSRNITLEINGSCSIGASVLPAGATNKALKYSSSNTKVVSVSSTGQIKGLKPGTAKVTVKAHNGKSATVNVTVNDPKKSTQLWVPATSVTIDCKVGGTVFHPLVKGTAKGVTISCSSSDPDVATYNAKNFTITSKKAGRATLTFRTSNGLSKKVTVTAKGAMTFRTSSMELEKGKTLNLKNMLTVYGMDRSKIRFSSSNEKILTVNAKTGEMKALKAGEAKVYAKCGDVTAVMNIDVHNETTHEITHNMSIKGGGTLSDHVKVIVQNGRIVDVNISSSASNCTFKPVGKTYDLKSDSRWIVTTHYTRERKSDTDCDSIEFGVEYVGFIKLGHETCSGSETYYDDIYVEYTIKPDGSVRSKIK